MKKVIHMCYQMRIMNQLSIRGNGILVIIIGANGSGKSKLGAWIEKQTPSNTIG